MLEVHALDHAVPPMESFYLPGHLLGVVEGLILDKRPQLAAPIYKFETIINDGLHQPAATGIDAAMLQLVHQGSIELPVYYCVSAATVVNAIVARFNSFYCIVLSEGLYGRILPIAAGLLTHVPLRTFLAGGAEPTDDKGLPKRSRRDAFALLHDQGANLADAEALRLCRYYIEVITYFVMAHEIGHIVGGHLDADDTEATFISEADTMTEEGGDRKRSLEIDADMFASLATAVFIGQRASSSLWEGLKVTPTAGMRMLFASAYILFSVMDLFGPEDALVRRSKGHPAPLIRINILGLVVANAFAQLSKYDRNSIWDQGTHAVRGVEIALYEMAGGLMTEAEAEAYTVAADAVWEEHAKRWDSIVAELDRTRRGSYSWAAVLP